MGRYGGVEEGTRLALADEEGGTEACAEAESVAEAPEEFATDAGEVVCEEAAKEVTAGIEGEE